MNEMPTCPLCKSEMHYVSIDEQDTIMCITESCSLHYVIMPKIAVEQISEIERDAARYRRIREHWIDCDELSLHGRLSVIDEIVDAAIEKQRGGV